PAQVDVALRAGGFRCGDQALGSLRVHFVERVASRWVFDRRVRELLAADHQVCSASGRLEARWVADIALPQLDVELREAAGSASCITCKHGDIPAAPAQLADDAAADEPGSAGNKNHGMTASCRRILLRNACIAPVRTSSRF